jgi:hypothetical protein
VDPKEASNIIEEALNKVVASQDDWEEGDLLIEWAVVAYMTNSDEEKGSSYPMFFSNGLIPLYRARGLFTTALFYLNGGGE